MDTTSNIDDNVDVDTSNSPEPAPKRRLVTTDKDGKLSISVHSTSEHFAFPAAPQNAGGDAELLKRKGRFLRTRLDQDQSQDGKDPSSLSKYSSLKSVEAASAIDKSADIDAETLEAVYANERGKVLAGGELATPLAVLNEMARQYGARVHFEFHEIRFAKKKRFMAEVFVGNRKGYGEASVKKLSAHMAAANLLRKVQIAKKAQYTVPVHYLVPGCRINPSVFLDLKYLCKILDLQKPIYIPLPRDPLIPDAPLHTYKCQIGKLICIGESENKYLARRWAAKKAYEALTGSPVDMDSACCGSNCVTMARCNLTPLSSNRKLKAADMRQQAYESEQRVSLSQREGVPAEVKEKEDGFDEELDAENMEEDEGGDDDETERRMNDVAISMTDDARQKLKGLRIRDDIYSDY